MELVDKRTASASLALSVFALAATGAAVGATPPSDNDGHKVTICHVVNGNGSTGYGYNIITIDESAIPAHSEHVANDGRVDQSPAVNDCTPVEPPVTTPPPVEPPVTTPPPVEPPVTTPPPVEPPVTTPPPVEPPVTTPPPVEPPVTTPPPVEPPVTTPPPVEPPVTTPPPVEPPHVHPPVKPPHVHPPVAVTPPADTPAPEAETATQCECGCSTTITVEHIHAAPPVHHDHDTPPAAPVHHDHDTGHTPWWNIGTYALLAAILLRLIIPNRKAKTDTDDT